MRVSLWAHLQRGLLWSIPVESARGRGVQGGAREDGGGNFPPGLSGCRSDVNVHRLSLLHPAHVSAEMPRGSVGGTEVVSSSTSSTLSMQIERNEDMISFFLMRPSPRCCF